MRQVCRYLLDGVVQIRLIGDTFSIFFYLLWVAAEGSRFYLTIILVHETLHNGALLACKVARSSMNGSLDLMYYYRHAGGES